MPRPTRRICAFLDTVAEFPILYAVPILWGPHSLHGAGSQQESRRSFSLSEPPMSATTDKQIELCVKAEFLGEVTRIVARWTTDKTVTEAQRCEGVAWNILALIDGMFKLDSCRGYSLTPLNGNDKAPDISGKLHEEYLHGL